MVEFDAARMNNGSCGVDVRCVDNDILEVAEERWRWRSGWDENYKGIGRGNGHV